MAATPVLSLAALNRATLARQLLLARSDLDPVTATGVLGGLQAQEPASPFIALWSRIGGDGAAALREAFDERTVVKATLMRATLHVVPATDYRRLQPAIAPLLEVAVRRARGDRPDDDHLERLRGAILEHASTPRRNSDLRDHVAALHDTGPADDTWWWVRRHVPLVYVPSGGPWGFEARPWLVTADAWLGTDEGFATEAEGTVHLVRRYLGAFGPASVADAASWSRLPIARLRPAVATLEANGELAHFRDEHGRALVDLVDAPRPDAATPAPPRLLAMWDSVLLAHADRTRIIDPADRARVVAANGDTYPTFLVDGRVAGLWWARVEHGRTVIDLDPFRPLAASTRAALEVEAEALARFVEPLEPDVYRRYRGRRDRAAATRDHRRSDP